MIPAREKRNQVAPPHNLRVRMEPPMPLNPLGSSDLIVFVRSYFLDPILSSHFPASAKIRSDLRIRSDLKKKIAGASGKPSRITQLGGHFGPKKKNLAPPPQFPNSP